MKRTHAERVKQHQAEFDRAFVSYIKHTLLLFVSATITIAGLNLIGMDLAVAALITLLMLLVIVSLIHSLESEIALINTANQLDLLRHEISYARLDIRQHNFLSALSTLDNALADLEKRGV